jgi:hypothetical protein
LIEFEIVFQLVSMPPSQRWLTKYWPQRFAASATGSCAWRLVPTNSTRPPPATTSRDRRERLVQHRHGLLQVDDVDAVAARRRCRGPSSGSSDGLVAEMHASLEQLAHGEARHRHDARLSFLRLSRRGRLHPDRAAKRL